MTTDRNWTDENEQQRRRAMAQLGATWPNGWTTRKQDAYAMAVRDLAPDEVWAAVDATLKGWTGLGCPPPGEVRKQALALREQHRTRFEAPAVGKGCPECARELGVGVQPTHDGLKAGWVCDRKSEIVHCLAHNTGWRGVLDEPEPELIDMHEALERGLISGAAAEFLKRRAGLGR